MSDTNNTAAVHTETAKPAKPKRPTMQDEADALFEKQMELASASKGSDRAMLLSFLICIFAFAILIFVIPDKTFSEQENRELQTLPKLSSEFDGTFAERLKAGKFLDRYFSGDFSGDVADYYADQFPARDLFVGFKGICELALFKGENNDVILGKDQYLLTRMDEDGTKNLIKNSASAAAFAENLKAAGIPVTFAAAGRVIDVMQDKLPALFPVETVDAPWNTLDAQAAADGYDYVNLRNPLLEAARAGVDVMYRTDHHWTTRGAYLAYTVLMEQWGLEPLPESAFTVETASDAFYGTAWRTAGLKWVRPDTVEFWRYDGDEDYTMTIHDTETEMKGFYDRSYLEVTDKYSAFISGNHAYVTIEKDGDEDRPRLMLVKDSFGHSLAPFLAAHFDLEIIDPRYYKQSAAALAKETGCDRVLLINNLESLSTSAVLGVLRME